MNSSFDDDQAAFRKTEEYRKEIENLGRVKTEHDTLGYPPGDDRIQYPEMPQGVTGAGVRY